MLAKLKSMGLFLVSPFIALAYIAAMPVVGMYLLVSIANEARKTKHAPEAQADEQ